ncbi:MAG: hypothetical protein RIF46_13640 [Cyclobacteriaceae bacterium]
MSNSIEAVVKRLAGDIPGAYAYVFDGELEKFIYKSEASPLMEKTIISLNKEKGLADVVNQSSNNLAMLNCPDTNRKFLIKKLAADLYFGLCVEQSEEIIAKAKRVMDASFT